MNRPHLRLARGVSRDRARHFVGLALLSALLLFSLLSVSANAATVGTLTQMASPNGCVTDSSTPLTGCGTGRSLLGTAPFFGSHAVALSPDGKNLYTASFTSNGLAVFDRDSTSGKLTQKSGTAGCIAVSTAAGCAKGKALQKPTSIAVSPDGKNVYVASIIASSVTVFDRNTSTGTLTQKSGKKGCIANSLLALGCKKGRALSGANTVAVSPDGKNVYVGSFTNDSISIFDRSVTKGTLSQKFGRAGCFTEAKTLLCQKGRSLDGAEGLTISPDGKSVYIGAALGNGVAVFTRDEKTGKLNQPPGTLGCVTFEGKEECAAGDGLVGADSMDVSPDNQNLYVGSGVGSSVAIFDRNVRNGHIAQIAGTAGCYTNLQHNGRCTTGVQLDGPEGIAVSPDGNTVYVGSFFSSSVTVFDRTAFTGTLVQRAGSDGCIVNVATSGCTTGLGLNSANSMAISPDGRSVYVGAFGSNGIASFSRARPPKGRVVAKVANELVVSSNRLVSVSVSCSGTTNRRCPGGLSLRASSDKLTTAALTTIGRGSFNVPVGQSGSVSVAISAQAYRYLQTNGSLPAVATLRIVEPQGQIRDIRQDVTLWAGSAVKRTGGNGDGGGSGSGDGNGTGGENRSGSSDLRCRC